MPVFTDKKQGSAIVDYAKERAGKAPPHTFVTIAQPNYRWIEVEGNGSTYLPAAKGQQAVIEVPIGEDPSSRYVHTHELLHARHTPAVDTRVRRLLKRGEISTIAAQIAEDIRLVEIGARAGLWSDAASLDNDTLEHLCSGSKVASARLSDGKNKTPKRVLALTLALRGSAHNGRVYRTIDEAHEAVTEAMSSHARKAREIAEKYGVHPSQDKNLADAMSLPDLLAHVAVKQSIGNADQEINEALALDDPADVFEALARCVQGVFDRLEEIQNRDGKGKGKEGDGKPQEGKGQEGGSGDGEGNEEHSDAAGNKLEPAETKSHDKKKEEKKKDYKEENADVAKQLEALDAALADRVKRIIAKQRQATELIQALKARSGSGQQQGQKSTDFALGKPGDGKIYEVHGHASLPASIKDAVRGSGQPHLSHAPVDDTRIWPQIHIQRPNLVRNFRAVSKRPGRPSLDGAIPKHYSRWFVDRAIMDSVGRRPGGTLLIDVSGSMSWAQSDTQALIEKCPAMTVALYSTGRHSIVGKGTDGLTRGLLTIVAKDGRAVDRNWSYQENGHEGGNWCDGAALAWLAKQRGPRIWFSDGHVTGPVAGDISRSESMTLAHLDDAKRICVLGSIMRTKQLGHVYDIFSGRARFKPMTWADNVAD